jgi:hypothetical protein
MSTLPPIATAKADISWRFSEASAWGGVPRHTGFVTTDEVLNTTPKTDSQPIVGRCKFRRPRLKRLFVVILDQWRTGNPQFAGHSRSFLD